MRYSPREVEKIQLHNIGYLAQKRLARGIRLNIPETLALIVTQIMELIIENNGMSVADLMDIGKRMLGRRQVMPGVGEVIDEVQIEGTK